MDEKNIKRNEMLDSARFLFKENGFHKTKMEDIALRAGVGKGTLYEYFSSKQEIFDEACVEYVKSIHNYVKEISELDVSFKDKLVSLFKGNQNGLEEEFEKNPVDYIMSYKNIISEKFVKTLFEYVSDMNKIIINIVDQGKEEGIVIKEIPSDIIACSIVGTMGEYFKLKMQKKDYALKGDDIIFNLLYNGFSVKKEI
ncbi:TetR/AcrR family transcriptional regulator [Sedimentibacter sp.]|uniref:TetR/AcrR family transcriptional regulator n=1 Tax=Sedimentibacter sp. TaxID=1960295 RepID=UPI0028B214DA|nr:TetR/AcrR family transcriptional regulator [Sedimentibacter sp.]